MTRALVVFVTCPNRRQAQRLAETVVRRRLAACVNILPDVDSRFWWQGRVDRACETLLMMKTTVKGFEPLRRVVSDLHPYDVPEIIAIPIQRAHQPYLRWIQASVRHERRSKLQKRRTP